MDKENAVKVLQVTLLCFDDFPDEVEYKLTKKGIYNKQIIKSGIYLFKFFQDLDLKTKVEYPLTKKYTENYLFKFLEDLNLKTKVERLE